MLQDVRHGRNGDCDAGRLFDTIQIQQVLFYHLICSSMKNLSLSALTFTPFPAIGLGLDKKKSFYEYIALNN